MAKERRAASEDLTEEEMAVFDLLTKPDPVLTDDERARVREVAKSLLAHVHEKLVVDWRRKAETVADVRVAIRDVLDGLPEEPYPPPVYDAKVQAVFDHVRIAYGDDGESAYEQAAPGALAVAATPPLPASIDEITEWRRAHPHRRRAGRARRAGAEGRATRLGACGEGAVEALRLRDDAVPGQRDPRARCG